MVAGRRSDGPRRGGRDAGVALLAAMMTALLLVALAGALVPLATVDTAIGAHLRRAVQGLYAAEAALEAVVSELSTTGGLAVARDGAWRSRFWMESEPRRPDGTSLGLDRRTRELRRRGAGVDRAGRGLRWRLVARGPLAGLVPLPPGYGPWYVAVWIAADAFAHQPVAAHAAAYGPRGAERAIQATLRRMPDEATPVSVRPVSWRVVR